MVEAIREYEINEVDPNYEFHPDLADEGVVHAICTAPVYQKNARVRARFAAVELVIPTFINGKLETTKTAKPGDAIVENPGGEVYATERASFDKRYDPDPENAGWFLAKGKVRAIRNPWGKPIAIVSPWGLMYGDEDCMLASTADIETGEVETPGKVYIIDGKAFQETYRLKE